MINISNFRYFLNSGGSNNNNSAVDINQNLIDSAEIFDSCLQIREKSVLGQNNSSYIINADDCKDFKIETGLNADTNKILLVSDESHTFKKSSDSSSSYAIKTYVRSYTDPNTEKLCITYRFRNITNENIYLYNLGVKILYLKSYKQQLTNSLNPLSEMYSDGDDDDE